MYTSKLKCQFSPVLSNVLASLISRRLPLCVTRRRPSKTVTSGTRSSGARSLTRSERVADFVEVPSLQGTSSSTEPPPGLPNLGFFTTRGAREVSKAGAIISLPWAGTTRSVTEGASSLNSDCTCAHQVAKSALLMPTTPVVSSRPTIHNMVDPRAALAWPASRLAARFGSSQSDLSSTRVSSIRACRPT
jgi:hypothetical protein